MIVSWWLVGGLYYPFEKLGIKIIHWGNPYKPKLDVLLLTLPDCRLGIVGAGTSAWGASWYQPDLAMMPSAQDDLSVWLVWVWVRVTVLPVLPVLPLLPWGISDHELRPLDFWIKFGSRSSRSSDHRKPWGRKFLVGEHSHPSSGPSGGTGSPLFFLGDLVSVVS